MSKDLYSILGVSKSASKDDIKKAYRKLSKELHPDKHKGDKTKEQQFKEINEAYEVLSDETKRQRYDQFGSADGAQFGGQGFGGFDFSNMQGNMGGFGDIFESFFGGNANARREREQGRDIEVQIRISFMESVTGVKKTIRLDRLQSCKECSGSGAAKGAKTVQCSQCHGSGQVVRTMQSFLGTVQQSSICNQCRGAGTIPEKPCTQCQGEGRLKLTEEVEVNVPAGIADGQALRIQQAGEAGKNGKPAGDLYVHITVDTNAEFEREGDNIHSRTTIHVLDALLGTTTLVNTVHGPVELKIPEGTQPNQVLRIKAKGMPVINTSRFGDHYITVNVEIPTSLSKSERKVLEEWKTLQ
jgi:molecular chaperone DnaJ